MTWKEVKLGDICEVIAGQSPPSSTYNTKQDGLPFFQGKADFSDLYPQVRMWCNVPQKIAQPDDILLSVRAPVGPTNLANQTCCIGRGLSAIRCGEQVHPKFLLYYFRKIEQLLASKGRGSTFSAITQSEIRNLEIPLPSLDAQRRIAAILDQADALRQKRRQALAALDRLTHSVFLDMFGDPVRNPKGWELTALGNVLESIDSGWSPKCSENAASANKWGILKLSAITSCEYNELENKELPNNFLPRPEIEVKQGDVLFSRKNTYELVAACVYVHQTRPKLMLSDLIFRLRLKPDAKILPIFLWQVLLHPIQRKQIQSLATGAAGSMPNISKAKLKEVNIILPPFEIQTEFAERINKTRQMRQQMQNAFENLNTLFHSLQQRAFRGARDEF